MKVLKKIVIISLVALLSIIVLNADNSECQSFENQEYRIGHFKDRDHSMKKIFKELDLSDDQKEMIRINRKEMYIKISAKRDELRVQREHSILVSHEGINKETMINNAQEKAKIIAGIKAEFLEKSFMLLSYEQKELFIQEFNTKL